jgi:hypothetical protein
MSSWAEGLYPMIWRVTHAHTGFNLLMGTSPAALLRPTIILMYVLVMYWTDTES